MTRTRTIVKKRTRQKENRRIRAIIAQQKQQNQARSPLLRLPPELRNLIYEFASEEVEVVNGSSREQRLCPPFRPLIRSIAGLLNTCRQTYHEAHPFRNRYVNISSADCTIGPNELRELVEREKCSKVHTLTLSLECALGPVGMRVPVTPAMYMSGKHPAHTPTFLQLRRVVVLGHPPPFMWGAVFCGFTTDPVECEPYTREMIRYNLGNPELEVEFIDP